MGEPPAEDPADERMNQTRRSIRNFLVHDRSSWEQLLGPSIRNSSSQGTQTFSPEQAKHALETAESEHRRTEERKDNELRRFILKSFFIFLLAALVVGVGISVGSANADTRRWAQGIVTLLIGTIAGAVGGYFTGKTDR